MAGFVRHFQYLGCELSFHPWLYCVRLRASIHADLKPFLAVSLCAGVLLLAAVPAAAQVEAEAEVKPEAAQDVPLVIESTSALGSQVDGLLLTRWLKSHGQLWSFLSEPELTRAEFDDLLKRAPADVVALLQTRGYFNAVATLDKDAGAPRIKVALGPLTTIESVTIAVLDEQGAPVQSLTEALVGGWSLPVGETFTQAAWQAAKDQAINTLASQVFYQASIASSQAEVDPRTHRAKLSVTLHTGPAFTFGSIAVQGASRYDTQGVVNMAHIAGLREGADYRAQALFDAQSRIMDSGQYGSAFVTLSPEVSPSETGAESNPDARRSANDGATELRPSKARLAVGLEVVEKPLKQTEASIGFSTDSGPRLHFTHTHYRVPSVDWQAVHTLDWQRDAQMVSSDWLSPLDARAWQWTGGLELKRQIDDNITTTSQHWRAGQTQSLQSIQRTYYVQWVQAKEEVRTQRATDTAALSAHWAWSQARWDNPSDPQTGHALSADMSAGLTLAQGVRPYLRAQTQGLWLRPFDNPKRGRLALRAGLGAVMAKGDTAVPSSELFLTGGDTSVRGYAVRSIGLVDQASGTSGLVLPGRLMWLGALEWQRPTTWGGDLGRLEQTFFVDAAAVSDRIDAQTVFVGSGTGVRFISPVGPMQMDVAYGHQTQEWRLHLFVGIRF